MVSFSKKKDKVKKERTSTINNDNRLQINFHKKAIQEERLSKVSFINSRISKVIPLLSYIFRNKI